MIGSDEVTLENAIFVLGCVFALKLTYVVLIELKNGLCGYLLPRLWSLAFGLPKDFKTRYKEKENKEVGEVLVDSKRIVLNKDEVNFLNSINKARGILPDPTLIMTNCASLEFEGINFIVTDELHQSLNEEQIKDWIDHENFFDESNKKKGVVVNFLKKSLRSKSIKKKHEKEKATVRSAPNASDNNLIHLDLRRCTTIPFDLADIGIELSWRGRRRAVGIQQCQNCYSPIVSIHCPLPPL